MSPRATNTSVGAESYRQAHICRKFAEMCAVLCGVANCVIILTTG